MREEGTWWVKPPTLAGRLVAIGSPFVFSMLTPMLGDLRKRTPLNVPGPWLYNPSFHRLDGMSLMVIAGGLVVLGLIGASSRWITRHMGRQPTSLDGKVTWVMMAGVTATVITSYALFPQQTPSVFAMTWLVASGVFFLGGQSLFGMKYTGEGVPA